MRWSQTLIPTKKEIPEGAEIPSHVLMVRAGLIGQVMAGAYTYLPLGMLALKKAERIVREEMNAAGAVELLMPALSPLSLWERSGRVEGFGNVLIQFSVRRQNRDIPLVLGPTHEEVITEMVARHIGSYRQLPITLYQVQTKFRNEERPRFGVLRTSEFLMKDAYSFDATLEGLNNSYETMYQAYCKIFARAGLSYLPVEAESGPIGGDASCEFMVMADNGEDVVVHCTGCNYAANLERADIGNRGPAIGETKSDSMTKVNTPGTTSIEQVTKLLDRPATQVIKTLIYLADDQPVAILIRGDHEANEAKIRRHLGASQLQLADPATVEKVTGAPVGFAGPAGLDITIWADHDIKAIDDAVIGANERDQHFTGAKLGRDFQVLDEHFADLRFAVASDPCPKCDAPLTLRHAIEVGHVFKLGTKYSEALGARFLDEKEQLHPIIMGCYGIGINRIIATAIETGHDDNGIIWPMSIAPYEVLVTPLNVKDEDVFNTATRLETELLEAGVEVLLDDRPARAGVKFKDADLIGIPLRIVIGGRGLKEGKLEVKWRWEEEASAIPLEGAAATIVQMVEKERANPSWKAGATADGA